MRRGYDFNPGQAQQQQMQQQQMQQQQMQQQAQPGMANPQAIQKEMGVQDQVAPQRKAPMGTVEDPYSFEELMRRRRAFGDTSQMHYEQDSEGNGYVFSNYGVAKTVQNDPMKRKLSQFDAKRIDELESTVFSAAKSQVNLDEINGIIASDVFKDLRTKDFLGGSELKWFEAFGTPEQKEKIAELKTYMGQVIKDASKDFKGTFRAGEQALLNSMKPNPSDTLSAMKGKAGALSYLNENLLQRSKLEAQFMREGMSPLDAKMTADQMINPDEIKNNIDNILHPEKDSIGGYSMEDLEHTAKKYGMTMEELMQEMGM
jgi:hypothetical protein